MSSNSSISTINLDGFGGDIRPPKGPPGWSQLVYVSSGNPYYVPNPFVISAGIWLLCCIFSSVWAVLAIRRNKGKSPITQSLAGWRYRLATTFAIVAFSWAVFDDTYRLVNEWVEQRLFLSQFVGDFFWDLARITLLLSICDLHFRLMRQSPLGSWNICRVHFWRYKSAKIAFCGLLVLLAFLMMCLRIAHLSTGVNHPPRNNENSVYLRDNAETAAIILCFIFDILYFLAGLEVVVVASVLLLQRRTKHGSGSKSMLVNNLILIAAPLFLAATFTLISTCIRPPPETDASNSLGPTSDGVHASLAAVHLTAVLLAGIGVVLPLGGIVTVAKQADASMERVERLTSDSLDQVLVGPGSNVSMEQTHPPPRPASSNYDDPESWGGSTRRPSYTV